MLRKITFAAALLALEMVPLAARADDSQKLLAEQHFTTIKSFKLAMAYRSPGGALDKILTYVAPDRLRLDIPKQKISAVTIGRFVWVRDPENHWHKRDAPKGSDPLSAVHSVTEIAKTIKGKIVTYVGDENLDGVRTHVYKLQAPPKAGYSAITEKLWLGVDGYPHKIEQRNGPFSMLATYSDFNAALSVAAQ